MTCTSCGATISEGQRFCPQCGTAVGQGAAPGSRPLSANDALAMAAVAAPVLGRGGGGDLAGYMMSKAALSSLEANGQGDSPMADMARAGLAVSKAKFIAGGIFFVIFLIIMLVVISNAMRSEEHTSEL